MRFIFNFIFFGLLFYAIYFFFPDAFMKLVGWAGDVFNYIKAFFQQLFSNMPPAKRETAMVLLSAFDLFRN